MGKQKRTHQPFQLTGNFLGFVVKDGFKVKGMRIATPQGEHYIKLSREARASCRPLPTVGMPLQIIGEQKVDDEDGAITYKARQVVIASPLSITPASTPMPQPQRQKKVGKACILVCRKSDCCKKGGREVIAGLQRELGDRQIAEQVIIRETGCMKKCKAGPNLVMPDKTRHSRVRAKDIPALLDKHGLSRDRVAG
ncbi:MAG: (2Fe-2S) ferredoxin domain-containing protein [Cyanobacteria bacterium J06638_20]